ncbi:GM21857 [Drosophila sechellia]|uniref:GM21857 n=1 Tax=Drosophila sechellia TaxID=7238 RepID=B4HNK5_DROSE|nr:GM21857 [Drosophila sechellia]
MNNVAGTSLARNTGQSQKPTHLVLNTRMQHGCGGLQPEDEDREWMADGWAPSQDVPSQRDLRKMLEQTLSKLMARQSRSQAQSVASGDDGDVDMDVTATVAMTLDDAVDAELKCG